MTEKKYSIPKKSLKTPMLATAPRSDGGRHAPTLKKPVGYPKVSNIFWQRATQEKLG